MSRLPIFLSRVGASLGSSTSTIASKTIHSPGIYWKALEILDRDGLPASARIDVPAGTMMVRGIPRIHGSTALGAITPRPDSTRLDSNRASGMKADGTPGNTSIYLARKTGQLAENYYYTMKGDFQRRIKAMMDGVTPDQRAALEAEPFSPSKVFSLVPYGVDARDYSLLTIDRIHTVVTRDFSLIDMDSPELLAMLKEKDPAIRQFLESGQSRDDYSLHRAIALAASTADDIRGTTFTSRRRDATDPVVDSGNFAVNGEEKVPLTDILRPTHTERFHIDPDGGEVVSEVTTLGASGTTTTVTTLGKAES